MCYLLGAGGWDYVSFADLIAMRHRSDSLRTDTVHKWATADVIPRNYRNALFRLIEDMVVPTFHRTWRAAFQTVWAEHKAARHKKPYVS